MFITSLLSACVMGRAEYLLRNPALPVYASDYHCIITRQIVNPWCESRRPCSIPRKRKA